MTRKFSALFLVFVLFFTFFTAGASATNITHGNSLEVSILTSTLGEPVGMQGFTGNYAITDFDEQVEIYVQFATPPAVALRLLQERGTPLNLLRARVGGSFYEQALSAHTIFRRQLSQIPMPLSSTGEIRIIDEHYRLFNGVLMSVPGRMVEQIAALPEVYGVFPNVIFCVLPYGQDAYEYYTYEVNAYAEITYELADSLVVNPEFMLETRELFDTDYIHNVMGITGAGVRVAVLDTGIQHDHPEFVRFQDGTGRIRGWQRGDNSVSTNINLRHGIRSHGTAVSGTIVAVAPGVELWNYRVNISGVSGLSTITAFETAHADDMDIINLSFGTMMANSPFAVFGEPLFSAVNTAVLDGVVVTASAGNDGWLGLFSVTAPATSSLAISVGAGNLGGRGETEDALASFSSRGPLMDTYHISPNIVAPGVQVYTADIDSGYSPVNGTSFSAPIIAGVAALLLEQFPNATPYEIMAKIMNTARPLAVDRYNNAFMVGAGFVDPIAALRSETLVTTQYYVPLTGNRNNPWELQTMAQLSFGRANPAEQDVTSTLPVTIRNNANYAITYAISYQFTNNPHGGAGMAFCQTSITIEPGEIAEFDVAIEFGEYASGYIQGYVHVKINENIIARVPFGVVTPFLASDLLAYGRFQAADWDGELGAEWTLHGDGLFVVESGLIGVDGLEFQSYFDYLRYIRRIVFTGPITAGNSLELLFFGMENLVSITGLEHFDTSNTTDMTMMFSLSPSLISVSGVSNWDVSNVTTMDNMFTFAESLIELDVSNWDVGNVTNMDSMFTFAESLEELDVSGWDTSNVTNMRGMFWLAESLTELDVSNWDVSNVTSMFSMFSNMESLTSLDLSNWDVSNVTYFGAMFWQTNSLRQITLSESFHGAMFEHLPNVLDNYQFTGYWQNVGFGTPDNPQGEFKFTTAELIASFDGETMADTWVWQPQSDYRLPLPPNLSIHDDYIIRTIDITDEQFSFDIINLNDTRTNLHLIAARYDYDGRLQQTEVSVVRIPSNFSIRTVRLPDWFDISDENSKIMLWEEGTMAPIIAPILGKSE